MPVVASEKFHALPFDGRWYENAEAYLVGKSQDGSHAGITYAATLVNFDVGQRSQPHLPADDRAQYLRNPSTPIAEAGRHGSSVARRTP